MQRGRRVVDCCDQVSVIARQADRTEQRMDTIGKGKGRRNGCFGRVAVAVEEGEGEAGRKTILGIGVGRGSKPRLKNLVQRECSQEGKNCHLDRIPTYPKQNHREFHLCDSHLSGFNCSGTVPIMWVLGKFPFKSVGGSRAIFMKKKTMLSRGGWKPLFHGTSSNTARSKSSVSPSACVPSASLIGEKEKERSNSIPARWGEKGRRAYKVAEAPLSLSRMSQFFFPFLQSDDRSIELRLKRII